MGNWRNKASEFAAGIKLAIIQIALGLVCVGLYVLPGKVWIPPWAGVPIAIAQIGFPLCVAPLTLILFWGSTGAAMANRGADKSRLVRALAIGSIGFPACSIAGWVLLTSEDFVTFGIAGVAVSAIATSAMIAVVYVAWRRK